MIKYVDGTFDTPNVRVHPALVVFRHLHGQLEALGDRHQPALELPPADVERATRQDDEDAKRQALALQTLSAAVMRASGSRALQSAKCTSELRVSSSCVGRSDCTVTCPATASFASTVSGWSGIHTGT